MFPHRAPQLGVAHRTARRNSAGYSHSQRGMRGDSQSHNGNHPLVPRAMVPSTYNPNARAGWSTQLHQTGGLPGAAAPTAAPPAVNGPVEGSRKAAVVAEEVVEARSHGIAHGHVQLARPARARLHLEGEERSALVLGHRVRIASRRHESQPHDARPGARVNDDLLARTRRCRLRRQARGALSPSTRRW